MTHCDFSAKTARDEMRHIIGGSEPEVIIVSDKDQNRGCKKRDKDHLEFLCELYEAKLACGRYYVHELTSEVNSRMLCVMKIMAMPGTRTAVADLCMFGLAACDKGGPGFVNVSVRTTTNARRVGARLHARINTNDTFEEGERTGTWVRQAARAIEEQLRGDQQESEMRERKRKVEDVRSPGPTTLTSAHARLVSAWQRDALLLRGFGLTPSRQHGWTCIFVACLTHPVVS